MIDIPEGGNTHNLNPIIPPPDYQLRLKTCRQVYCDLLAEYTELGNMYEKARKTIWNLWISLVFVSVMWLCAITMYYMK